MATPAIAHNAQVYRVRDAVSVAQRAAGERAAVRQNTKAPLVLKHNSNSNNLSSGAVECNQGNWRTLYEQLAQITTSWRARAHRARKLILVRTRSRCALR